MNLLAIILVVLVGAAAAFGFAAPWSASGWLLLSLAGLPPVAFLLGPSPVRRVVRRVVLRIVLRILGALWAVLLVLLLAIRAGAGSSGRIRMVTLPGATTSRLMSCAFDEQDLALAGARFLLWQWRLPPDERAGLLPALRGSYLDMRADAGSSPSPMLDTLLARQTPTGFDTLVITRGDAPRVGVVFLHGYGGSATLECWLMSRAADTIGATTVCPATAFSGHWSSRDGERTLRTTLDYLRGLGVRRVYLAGLSNGAAGAGVLAGRFPDSFAGLILISGTPGVSAEPGVPTLVVQGERDTIASAAAARAFAARAGATFAGFDAGHFALLTKRSETSAAIAAWLRLRESKR